MNDAPQTCDYWQLHVLTLTSCIYTLLSFCFVIGAQTAVTERWCPTCHRRPSAVPRSSPAVMQRVLLNSSGETVRHSWKIYFSLSLSNFEISKVGIKWDHAALYELWLLPTRSSTQESREQKKRSSLLNKKIIQTNKDIGLFLWSPHWFFHWAKNKNCTK